MLKMPPAHSKEVTCWCGLGKARLCSLGWWTKEWGQKTSSERPPPLAHVEPLALQELPDGVTANQEVVVLP